MYEMWVVNCRCQCGIEIVVKQTIRSKAWNTEYEMLGLVGISVCFVKLFSYSLLLLVFANIFLRRDGEKWAVGLRLVES